MTGNNVDLEDDRTVIGCWIEKSKKEKKGVADSHDRTHRSKGFGNEDSKKKAPKERVVTARSKRIRAEEERVKPNRVARTKKAGLDWQQKSFVCMD